MNSISTHVSQFAADLRNGAFYKKPLDETQKAGHAITAAILEKALRNGEIMGSLAADLLNDVVALQIKLNFALMPKSEATPPEQTAENAVTQDSVTEATPAAMQLPAEAANTEINT